jgi:3-deoxy-D-manno-octulosonic-acid transferase
VRRIYTLLIYLVAPFAFGIVLWRGLRDRGYWQGLGERFGFGADSRGSIWLHAVSLGEVSAIAALVRALRTRYPDTPLILTTSTPTGRARAQALFGGTVGVRFLPYDMPGSVARFLERVRPQLAIILETELWPNLFHACAARGVPLLLASARISAKSVSRYRRLGGLFRGIFPRVVIAAQTAEDAARFTAIGADAGRIHVIGNVKFDMDIDPTVIERGRALRSGYLDRPTWTAGSTHAGEEEQLLEAHAELLRNCANALLLLVPRHPNRFDSVAALLTRRGCRFVRRSSGAPAQSETQVVLVDTVGELASFYACADVAFVGGSLVPIGGHNLLEPAALGLPVLTGPSNSNGRDIADLLMRQGALIEAADAKELAVILSELFSDAPRRERIGAIARHAVAMNRGSVARLLQLIEPLLVEPLLAAASP